MAQLTLFWWGPVNLAHPVDDLVFNLENLLVLITVSSSFQALSVNMETLHNVALQNKFFLHQLLAAQGMIGILLEIHISYILDMTHVVSHLNLLLQREIGRNSS